MIGKRTGAAMLTLTLLLFAATPALTEASAPPGGGYTVDFDYLRQINEDAVAWLYQSTDQINDPVLQGTDNDYYLKRLINDSRNCHGSLMMDFEAVVDFSDPVTYFYGCAAEEGDIFDSLSHYQDQAYYRQHPVMTLITPGGNYEATLFAGLKTSLANKARWMKTSFSAEAEFNAYLDGLVSQSFFTPNPSSLPKWGDRLLVLVSVGITERSKRSVIFCRLRPTASPGEAAVDVSKLSMDERATSNGYTDIEGVGSFMVYAQNDELWEYLRYESPNSGKRRWIGEGGCSPTAAAIAIANLVDKERLPDLSAFAENALGYTFCPCSVNHYVCNHQHPQYQMKTPDEFLRYLPLAIASFATGNNQWNIRSRWTGQGTSMGYLEKLCEVFDISITRTRVAAEAIELLREGNGRRAVISCAINVSPFTSTSHFVVMVAADEDYVYFIDPLRDNRYKPVGGVECVETLAPGVVRIKAEMAARCGLSPHYVLEAPAP